eukprot:3927505-Pleurochrysis_carterae.AAC.1
MPSRLHIGPENKRSARLRFEADCGVDTNWRGPVTVLPMAVSFWLEVCSPAGCAGSPSEGCASDD